MSLASIEARALEFMGQHKGDLATLLAKAEAKLVELGHDVEALFADDAPAKLYGTAFPEIIDVAPASTEPEVLDEQGQWIPAPPATKVEYSGGPIDDMQVAVDVFNDHAASQQPPIDNDHVAPGAEQFASDVIEGADAAPADQPAQDAQQ